VAADEARLTSEVPRDPVEALRRLPLDAAHDVPGRVLHRQDDHGLLLPALGFDLGPAREGCVLPRLEEGLLLLLPRLLPALDVPGQVVGEDRPEGRVVRGEEVGALRGLAVLPEGLALQAPPRLADREERRFPRQRLLRRLPQRRVVVENEEAAPEEAAHEVVLAPLDREVAEGDRRHAAAELHPAAAPVRREEEPELGPREEEVRPSPDELSTSRGCCYPCKRFRAGVDRAGLERGRSDPAADERDTMTLRPSLLLMLLVLVASCAR
jgi:hypothetical protein